MIKCSQETRRSSASKFAYIQIKHFTFQRIDLLSNLNLRTLTVIRSIFVYFNCTIVITYNHHVENTLYFLYIVALNYIIKIVINIKTYNSYFPLKLKHKKID